MDIPSRNLAEEALQLALDSAGAGTWDWNVQSGELVWSKQCLAMFGLPPDTEMSYEKFLQVVHPEDRERIDRAVKAALEERTEYAVEMRTIWPDGSLHWVASRGRAYFDESGQAVRMIGAGLDITKLKTAEGSLRASEARYRELAENLDRQVQARTLELQHRNEQVLRAAEDLRELSGRVLRVQDEERRRIARELHDSAGQILTALGLELGGLAEDIQKLAPQLEAGMAEAQELVQQLHREIRTTSYLLHPPLLDEAGLSSALSWYIEGLSQRSGIEIHLDIAEDFGRLPRDMELVMFRLVQESMTNIHRHSGSATAEIRIARESGAATIEVQDHGKGMSEEALRKIRDGGSGVGIRGMRERLRQFRGDLRIESNGSGTQVFVRIPIPQNALVELEGQPLQRAV